ncbi:MAG: GDSL-type esterase/lipase family protein [Clostridia bacterium]|nr:GDSL-type esterase/lipase family protein [Clostridia bacterium]
MEPIKVFCYGDSNTFGFEPVTRGRHPYDVRWTGVLQEMLGSEYRVLEQGSNGRTASYTEPFEVWKTGSYALLPALHMCKPAEVIIFMLGTNDLKFFFRPKLEEIAEGMEKLVVTAREFLVEETGVDPKIILAAPIYVGENIEESWLSCEFKANSAPLSRQIAPLYREIAERQNCCFLDASLYAQPAEEDQIHMNAEGHRALAEAMHAAVLKVLGK